MEARVGTRSFRLGRKFEVRVRQDGRLLLNDTKNVIGCLEDTDPTPNKQYTQWLAKAYANGSEFEDLTSRGRVALKRLGRLKSKKLLPVGQSDIGRLENLEALEDLVRFIELPEDKLIDKGRYEEWLNNDEVRVIIPLDETAACYYGQGTRWCTAVENGAFRSYHNRGHLVIFIPKNPKYHGEKYQVHIHRDQWMDEKDHRITSECLKDRFRSISWLQLEMHIHHSHISELEKGLEIGTILPQQAHHYCLDIVKGRYLKAEPYIMKDVSLAYYYAKNIVQGRWPEAEPIIMKDMQAAYHYAFHIIKSRWPEAEPYIGKSPGWAYHYAEHIIKGRWPEAEPIIMENPQAAYYYARYIIKGRWPEAEPYIMKDPYHKENYWRYLQQQV